MADNATITPGSGITVGADDVGGVLMQRVKPVWGPDGTATDVDAATGLPVQPGYKELSGSASANNTDLVLTDASGYRWISVQVSGPFAGTVSVQQSNDNTTFYAVALAGPNGPANTFINASLLSGPLNARYVRVRFTAYTSGTATATVGLSAAPSQLSSAYVYAGQSFGVTGGGAASADAQSGASSFAAQGSGYNGATWDRLRTPTTFKSAAATASGNTAVWTPGASKKFRLMRYKIDVSQDAAQSSGGIITIGLQDSTTDMGMSQSVFVPATAATTMGPGWTSGWIDLGNGRISSTINLVMNVNLSAALTSGTVRVVAAGVEE